MSQENLAIINLSKDDLREFMLNHAVKEGWNYSEEDVEAYYAINHNSIYGLKINNNLAGCVIITKYLTEQANTSLVSIGFFLVREEFRGKKLVGPKLWNETIVPNLNSYICSLSSVPRTVGLYGKNGFFQTPIISSHYHTDTIHFDSNLKNTVNCLFTLGVLEFLSDSRLAAIEEYEKNLFGDFAINEGRVRFRDIWLKRPDAIAILYLNNNKLEGYGVATKCRQDQIKAISYRLSPVYANTIDVANMLLASLVKNIANCDGKSIELYAPTNISSNFPGMFEKYGLVKMDNADACLMLNVEKALLNTHSAPLERVVALTPLEYPHEAVLAMVAKNNL